MPWMTEYIQEKHITTIFGCPTSIKCQVQKYANHPWQNISGIPGGIVINDIEVGSFIIIEKTLFIIPQMKHRKSCSLTFLQIKLRGKMPPSAVLLISTSASWIKFTNFSVFLIGTSGEAENEQLWAISPFLCQNWENEILCSQIFPQIYSNLLSCPIELGFASQEAARKYSQHESGLWLSTSVFPEVTFCHNLWWKQGGLLWWAAIIYFKCEVI